MLGLLVLSIVGTVAMLYFGTSLMKKNSENLINAKLNNVGSDTEEQTYMQARKDLQKYSGLNEVIQSVLPSSKDQAQAVQELYQIGDETGIVVDKIQFPSSTLGLTGAAAQSTTGAASSVTQAIPVTGMPNVLGITMTIDLQPSSGKSISYADLISFLQKVEMNRRFMQVTNISVESDTTNGGVDANATITIFVKP